MTRRLGSLRARRAREADAAERAERRALRSQLHAEQLNGAEDGDELKQMLGLMQGLG